MTFVVLGIILEVKIDADSENGICQKIPQRLGVLLLSFNEDGLVFRKIFIFSHLSRVGYRSRGKKVCLLRNYFDDWICRRVEVVNALTGCLSPKSSLFQLHIVSNVFEGLVRFC